jgi:hypothetical protein
MFATVVQPANSVVPPPIATGPTSAWPTPPPFGTPLAALADTITDLPKVAISEDPVTEQEISSDSESITTQPLELLLNEIEPASIEVSVPFHSNDLMAVLWPLTIFVLAPLALFGVGALVWMLVHAL